MANPSLKQAKIDFENALHDYNIARIDADRLDFKQKIINLEHARHNLELERIERKPNNE